MLSKGGMGALYLAEDRETRSTVVVKALTDYFDTSDERQLQAARARLAHEARTLAALRHPAIPRLLDTVEDDQQHYVVMEHIVGTDLERRLSRTDGDGTPFAGRPYPREEVLRLGVALCRVLEHLGARPQPLVHHDIKPSNVLVDVSGDAVYLVDFGTAQVRLDPDTDAMAQPSLYGTVGYAPPEQYRGRSEPRSDVYALAATLYHLATDDDPSLHPFAFPQLGALGSLGEVLRGALTHEVADRPTAAHLRARLELLLEATGTAPLRAPDGTKIPHPTALVAWCLHNWQAATVWLNERLPDQIELWWGDAELAHELRRVVRTQSDRNLALDAVLALVDPRGLGREKAHVAADLGALDLGQWPGQMPWRDLTVTNVGRRLVSLHVFLPRWVHGSHTDLLLPPGVAAKISVQLDISQVYLGGRLRDRIYFRDRYSRQQNDTLLGIPVRATVSRRAMLARRYGLPLGGAGMAVLVWVGSGFPLPQPPPSGVLEARLPPPAVVRPANREERLLTDAEIALANAEQLFKAGDYAGAAERLESYRSQHGDSYSLRLMLHQSYLRLGEQALDREDWMAARELAARVLIDDPESSDARLLAARSYALPAADAAERGDFEGARMLWQALLLRHGDLEGAQDGLKQVYEAQALAALQGDDMKTAADLIVAREQMGGFVSRPELTVVRSELVDAVMQRRRATWRDGAREVFSVRDGHAAGADLMALSPDGALLASAGPGNVVRIRRTTDGALVHLRHIDADNVTMVSFSPDGAQLVIIAAQRTIVFDTIGWRAPGATTLPATQPATTGDLTARVADLRVEIVPAAGSAPLRTVELDVEVRTAMLSEDGRVLATLNALGELSVWRPWASE
jgi:tRNA A-37 threonylcarbamoyl transferase component Bud32/tetratricopeptide (TPR) repeat protein